MGDKFVNTIRNLTGPASDVVLITPSDTQDLLQPVRGIAFGTAGALKVLTYDGSTVIIPSGVLAPGMIHPIRVRRVFSTGTTVTNIIGAL